MHKFQKHAWKIKKAVYCYNDVIAKRDKYHLHLICSPFQTFFQIKLQAKHKNISLI